MVKAYGHKPQVSLMIWETNPKKYNKKGLATKVNSLIELKKGDKLFISSKTYFLIDDILDKKDSSLKGYIYYTLKTSRCTN